MFIVTETNFQYNDYTFDKEGSKPILSFTSRESAEEKALELNAKDYKSYGSQLSYYTPNNDLLDARDGWKYETQEVMDKLSEITGEHYEYNDETLHFNFKSLPIEKVKRIVALFPGLRFYEVVEVKSGD